MTSFHFLITFWLFFGRPQKSFVCWMRVSGPDGNTTCFKPLSQLFTFLLLGLFSPPSVDRRSPFDYSNVCKCPGVLALRHTFRNSRKSVLNHYRPQGFLRRAFRKSVQDRLRGGRSVRRNNWTRRQGFERASESLSTIAGWKSGKNTATLQGLFISKIKEYEHYIYRQH